MTDQDAHDQSGEDASPPPGGDAAGEPAPPRGPRGFSKPAAAALAAVAVVLAWSYAPEWRGLYDLWNRDPNYSHGYLVVPLALAIFWKRLKAGGPVRLRPWWPAWGGLVLTLLARGLFHLWGNQWGEVATLLPALACLTLTFGGWGLFRRAWPAIAYLVFMMPLPAKVDNAVALPLQMLATSASVGVLQLTGLWVIAEGNVINVGADRLEVATACNGLSMLETLAATVTAMILLLPVRRWKQLVLLASAVPIALASNVARIAATAWCYQKYGAVAGERFAHDAAGWLMMPLALAAVGLELLLLNWVVVEEETVEEPSLLGRPIARGRTPARGRPARPGPADDRTVEDRETP